MKNQIEASIGGLALRMNVLETREASDTGWIALPYATGWVDLSVTWMPGEYRKIGDFVYLRGVVQRTSGTSATIATLPTDFRPTIQDILSVQQGNAFARLTVDASGNLTTTGTVSTWWALTGASFSVI